MKEQKTTQVRVRKGCVVMGAYSAGRVIFVTPSMARKLHAAGAVEIIGDEQIEMGDPEVKQLPPAAMQIGEVVDGRKSFDAPTNGPSTGSASLSEPGKGEPSSASEAVQASSSNSNEESLIVSQPSEPPTGVESSQSMTPTESVPSQTSSTSQTNDGGNGTASEESSSTSAGRSARSRTRATK